MALIRFLFIFFIVLTVIYWALSIYSRSLRREKLEDQWAEDHPGIDESAERNAYISQGMEDYEGGLRKKLIWLVYIIPTVLVIAILIITNAD